MQTLSTSVRAQQGVALVMALMILLIISVLGISAMRTSLFSSKIALGAQVGTMTFQASESAIAAVYDEARGDISDPNNVLGRALLQKSLGVVEIQDRCLTKTDLRKADICANSDFMDSRDLLRAGSETIVKDQMQNVPGFEIGSWVYYEFVTAAHAEMPTYNVNNTNIQEFRRIAPGGGLGP